MTVWFVILVPLVIMFFALFMERVESRLKHVAVQENEVEEFLEQLIRKGLVKRERANMEKGSTWVVEETAGRITSARYVAAP